MRHGWLGAVAGMALCWSASAADLRIGVASEVTTLDPHFFHLTSNTEIDKLIYSGLVTQDADLKVIPDLAASWRTLDETHWEFKLRPGVTWHDGSPFTADDVVFTYQRARNVPNSPASFLQFLKHVAKTTAVDAHTVVIETDQPDPILLNEILNVWIVSRKNGENATTADYNSGKAAIGTGPYREVEWVPGDRIVLERFDGYFGDKPDWQRVTYKPITNDASRVAALLSGDVDLISNVPGNDVVTPEGESEDHAWHDGEQPLLLLDARRRSRRVAADHRHGRQAADQEPAEGCAGAARDVDGDRSRRAGEPRDAGPGGRGGAVHAGGRARHQRQAEAGGVRSGRREEAAGRGGICRTASGWW